MFIDRALIHPGWQLQFKVVDSTSIVTLLPSPRCSEREFELSATRDTRVEALSIVAIVR